MNTFSKSLAAITILALFSAPTVSAQSQQVEILPSKDNTLFQSANGAFSNGAGSHLFFGVTNQNLIRRALLAFDVAGNVPAGAVIESASLQLSVTRARASTTSATLHQVTQDWGEGTSDAPGEEGAGVASTTNDATWVHTFFDTQTWTTQGGDFIPGSLSTASVPDNGAFAFSSTPQFAGLVQSWLDTPSGNFGVMIVGDEDNTLTAKRVGSREGGEGNRPRLVVTYSIATAAEESELPSFLTTLSVYPNPATGASTLAFGLAETRQVQIDVVDVAGRTVSTPVSGLLPAGEHATAISTGDLSPGIYLVRLQSGTRAVSKTIVVQ